MIKIGDFGRLKLFLISQLVIYMLIIGTYQFVFNLQYRIFIGHLFVVFYGYLFLILLGFLLFSFDNSKLKILSKYILSGLIGLFIVSIYYSYLFAFLGEYFNSKIFTIEIVLGYLKYFKELIKSFSLNPIPVYLVLLIIPLIIVSSNIWIAGLIQQKIIQVKKPIQTYFQTKIGLQIIHINLVVFIVLIAMLYGVFYSDSGIISKRLLSMEEPYYSVFLSKNDPFQGQDLPANNDGAKFRNEYPKNLTFNKKNIIVIVVDALRSDHLSLFGYKRKTSPFIDSLYASGKLKKVDLSFSPASASFPGINGILRSKVWANMGNDNFSLQQLLMDQGYQINFLVSGNHTSFYNLKAFYGKNSDFNYYIDGSCGKKYIVNDDRLIFEGLENIKNYHNNPSYFHFHLVSPHSTAIRQNNFKVFIPADPKRMDFENYTNRYDNGVLQADYFVREIFKSLQVKGYLKNSIVVITADHGEELGERGKFGHGHSVYTNQLIIPILFYDADSVSYKNLSYATSLDIAPTLVDRLGLPISDSWEGNSLYSEGKRELTYHQMKENFAIVYTKENIQLKYIFNNHTKVEEVYDLKSDLYETKNIIHSMDKRILEIFRKQMDQFHLSSLN